MGSNTEQRHRQSAIDRLGQIVELAAQGRAALSEGADAAETAALLESLKWDVKAVLEYLEAAAREATPPSGTVFKTCSSCQRDFTTAQWADLKQIGVQRFDDPEIAPLDLRNCPCGTTLALEIKGDR